MVIDGRRLSYTIDYGCNRSYPIGVQDHNRWTFQMPLLSGETMEVQMHALKSEEVKIKIHENNSRR